MVKTHHTPPRFLQEKLSPKKISFVKKHIATFIEKLKKKNKGELPSNPQLLCQYIDYLGSSTSSSRVSTIPASSPPTMASTKSMILSAEPLKDSSRRSPTPRSHPLLPE